MSIHNTKASNYNDLRFENNEKKWFSSIYNDCFVECEIWLSYTGVKLGYQLNINNLIGLKIYSSFYYGASNSKESSYTNTLEAEMDKGFMFNLGFKVLLRM